MSKDVRTYLLFKPLFWQWGFLDTGAVLTFYINASAHSSLYLAKKWAWERFCFGPLHVKRETKKGGLREQRKRANLAPYLGLKYFRQEHLQTTSMLLLYRCTAVWRILPVERSWGTLPFQCFLPSPHKLGGSEWGWGEKFALPKIGALCKNRFHPNNQISLSPSTKY